MPKTIPGQRGADTPTKSTKQAAAVFDAAAVPIRRAGFALKAWCAAAGFCPATYYNLPTSKRPRSVTVGRRRIITESPEDYLARIAVDQGGA